MAMTVKDLKVSDWFKSNHILFLSKKHQKTDLYSSICLMCSIDNRILLTKTIVFILILT